MIDARSGTVVSGGTARVASAVLSHKGLTLRIGGTVADSAPVVAGLLTVSEGATVQEVAAGLHAAGAKPQEIAAMFLALREVGALSAEVVVR